MAEPGSRARLHLLSRFLLWIGNLFAPAQHSMERDISSINNDFRYQKLEWPLARIFWFLIMVVLAYGLIGGLGDSSDIYNRTKVPLAEATLVYDKFLRVEKRFTTEVHFHNAAESCTVSFNKDYLDKVLITHMVPEPDKVEVIGDRIIFKFSISGRGTVTFFKDPLRNGKQKLELDINNEKVLVSQLIYF